MILDTYGQFCNATALNTGAAGSYLLGDVINLEDLRDIGQGNPVYLVIIVSTTATSGGSGTYAFSLCSDAQAAIAVDTTQTTHYSTAAIPVATLVAGYNVATVVIPMEDPDYEQYLGIVQTTAVAAATAGNIHAFLTRDVSKWKAYADGTN